MENENQDVRVENKVDQKRGNNGLWYLVGTLFVLLFVAMGVIFYLIGQLNKNTQIAGVTDESFAITLTPTITPNLDPTTVPLKMELDRNFSFPILDAQGEKVSELIYKISEYELTKEVSVNGRNAVFTDDNILLIFDVEITNEANNAFNIVASDYLRLSINGEEKWIAAEINSDPVEVRPKSTKQTRIGFKILEGDSNLRLQVGEVDGEKEVILLGVSEI